MFTYALMEALPKGDTNQNDKIEVLPTTSCNATIPGVTYPHPELAFATTHGGGAGVARELLKD